MSETPGLIICTPTRDGLTDETKLAIELNLDGFEYVHLTEVGLPVVEARNLLWKRALHAAIEHPDWYVLLCDDDAYWPPGTIASFVETLRHHPLRIDFLSGNFSARSEFSQSAAEQFGDLPPDGVVQVNEYVGAHFGMFGASLFSRLGRAPWDLRLGFGEASREGRAFFYRMLMARVTIAVQTANPIWHVDRQNGYAYAPGERPCRIRANQLIPTERPADEPYEFRTYGLPVDGNAEYQRRERAAMAEVSRLRREIYRVNQQTQWTEKAVLVARRQRDFQRTRLLATLFCRLFLSQKRAV